MGAKQNLKQYLEVKRITPAQFYRDSNLSNGFLNQGDNISSNNIEIIISLYPDINLAWLITGNGEMLNSPNEKGRMLNEINVNSSIKNTHLSTHPNTHLSDKSNKNAYPSPRLGNTHSYPSIVAESDGESLPIQQYSGANDIIMNLVEQIKEQSEEIGSLRQENSSLKHHLAQLAGDAGDVNSVPA